MTCFLSSASADFPKAIFRSLLQKLVRRGHIELSERVAFTLAKNGDSKWLQTRANVILFEECWSLVPVVDSHTPTIVIIKKIAESKKNKNAAGLGSLAYEYSIGNESAAKDSPDSLAVRIVAAGLKRPEAFFNWMESKSLNIEQKKF